MLGNFIGKLLAFSNVLFILTSFSTLAQSADKLVIISPHRKSIQEEYIPAFESYYKEKFKTEIKVDWLDQGGTSDDVRFVRARFAKNPKTSEVDIFWGGGTAPFEELKRSKLLQALSIDANTWSSVPADISGIRMKDPQKFWMASAMSSFGIFYNKKLLTVEGITEPKLWKDLNSAKFFNLVSAADPRRSGGASAVNQILLEAYGWEKGWEVITATAANIRQFTHSSSDPIKAVTSGDAVAAMVIDFYAFAKIDEVGADKLGFVMPEGQTILDPDPIAILKGAPNSTAANRFIEFVLMQSSQELLMLAKGQPNGPKLSYLGRLAVTEAAYKATEGKRPAANNPFVQKNYLKLDAEKAGKTRKILEDLVGAIHVDTHRELKEAWQAILKAGSTETKLKELAEPLLSEKELLSLAEKWDSDAVRNQNINKWVETIKARYAKLKSQPK